MRAVSRKTTRETEVEIEAEVAAAAPAVENAQPAADLSERIRRRAYELFVQRGYENGHDTEDWLQAEREIAGEESQTPLQ